MALSCACEGYLEVVRVGLSLSIERLEAVLFVPYQDQLLRVPKVNIVRKSDCCGGCAAVASWQPAQVGRRRFCEAARVQCCAMLLTSCVLLHTEQVHWLLQALYRPCCCYACKRTHNASAVPCVCTQSLMLELSRC